MIERRLIEVEGLVQGVGFRPFVHELATRLALRGHVRNDAAGVSIDVEGDRSSLDAFLRELATAPPRLAVIQRVRLQQAAVAAHAGFHIETSAPERVPEGVVQVAPDVATCEDCLRELFDPGDRRHRYPFLSCTHCGPRLTIQLGAPYDRQRTTMAPFVMCTACRREYEDPSDRRFHAQTIACAACGPALALRTADDAGTVSATGDDALSAAAAHLRGGEIIAVKGLGGYHLACDATNDDAVRRLRARKRREAKPLAVMLRDLDAVRRLCVVTDEETLLLASPQRPIVLVAKRMEGEIADAVAPGHTLLGAMLPYTPLHHLLLDAVGRAVVMTSGNASDEPIAHRDDEAFVRLAAVADLFLTHDREIATRCDDSVVRVIAGASRPVRRSRGFAPRPIALAQAASAPTLGVGGHLKNTFCLMKGHSAFLSHHVGDLGNVEAFQALEAGIAHYTRLFDVVPEVVAHDLHPDFLSTQLAERLPAGERIGVQHHHAHIMSCVVEHGVDEPVIGVAFDGTGLGTDGAIWGGEFLLVDGARFERVAHLSYVPLPGGDAAIRHPWRIALSHLRAAYGGDAEQLAQRLLDGVDARERALVEQLLTRPTLSPPTSSVGRLFDAVAALLGVRLSARFEAQAAMELEMLADRACTRGHGAEVREAGSSWTIDAGSLVRAVMDDVAKGRPTAEIAGAFHVGLCDATVDVVGRIARQSALRRVALSGGVFQNAFLTERLTSALSRAGFDVLLHRQVPCNDGGLSLGQAAVAARRSTSFPSSQMSPCV